MSNLTPEELAEIGRSVFQHLNEDARSRWIPAEKHAHHHDVMDEIIAEREAAQEVASRRQKMTDDLKVKIIGGLGLAGIISLLGLIGYGIIYLLQDLLTKPPTGG